MPPTCYVIEQFQGQWLVSVGGTKVLTCKTKRTALRAARRAAVLLHQSLQAEFPGHEGCATPAGLSFVALKGFAPRPTRRVGAVRPRQLLDAPGLTTAIGSCLMDP
jgi:hypothetical protein